MKRILVFVLLVLASSTPFAVANIEAGTQIIDGSSNAVFTDLASNGSLGALNSAVTLTLRGQGKATVQVVSVGTQTLSWEGTVDNANWFALNGVVPTTGASAASATAAGQWQFDTSSLVGFRVRCSAYTSGSASVFLNASLQAAVVNLGNALPTGANTIGKVNVVGNASGAFDAVAGAAVPANGIYLGARAATSNPSSVAVGNLVGVMADKAGKLVGTAGCPRELVGVQTTNIAASTAETTIVTAGGAGVFNDISQLVITTTDAAAATITIKDATAGTTRMVLDYPNATLAPAAPMVIPFNVLLAQAAANANWTATVSVNAGSVKVTAVFCKQL